MNNNQRKEIFAGLIADFLKRPDIPEEERFDGLILTMKAHGLPCYPERINLIRKRWQECIAWKKQSHKNR